MHRADVKDQYRSINGGYVFMGVDRTNGIGGTTGRRSLCMAAKLTLLLGCLLVSLPTYSQGFFRGLGKSKKGIKIERTIAIPSPHGHLAYQVARQYASHVRIKQEHGQTVAVVQYYQPLIAPYKITGSYTYLKSMSKQLKKIMGNKLLESHGYNGAHHIVTKTIIERIAKEEGRDMSQLHDMQNNAPAVYSPLHNHASYGDLFHDHDTLFKMYHSYGVKGIVTNFFERLNEENEKVGLPLYDEQFIERELLEAELWAKYWDLKWE